MALGTNGVMFIIVLTVIRGSLFTSDALDEVSETSTATNDPREVDVELLLVGAFFVRIIERQGRCA